MTSSSPTSHWRTRHDDVVIALALVTDAQSEEPAGDERAQTWEIEDAIARRVGKAEERVLSQHVSRLESHSASIGADNPACRSGG